MSRVECLLEDETAPVLDLAGVWEFSLAGQPPLRVPVPSAWEQHVTDKVIDGPAIYRRDFDLPADWLAAGRRIIFEADAISFEATLRLNGQAAGDHRGMWAPFQLDVTDVVRPGRNTLELEVWKPGGRWVMREALAGFLPDVCTTFGGPWQGLRLRTIGAALADLRLLHHPGAQALTVAGRIDGVSEAPGVAIQVKLRDAVGACRRSADVALTAGDTTFAVALDTAGLERWLPEQPALHTVTVSAMAKGRVWASAQRRTGLREVRLAGGAAWLEDRPLHLRGVLDWGWHPQRIAPAPSREEVLRQFAQARALGFNLVKLCLFVPDDATFAAADEAGMYLWLEMPMWLPRVTPAFQDLARQEYAALFRRLHHHASIVVLSLGCELNASIGADFLRELHGMAQQYFPSVLHCDNSGSAEAYGGVQTRLSDFHDYHFYTDPHFFEALIDHFDRGYQPARPWLYGEFCDVDTCRDFGALQPEPWWLTDPVWLTRDDFVYMRQYRERLEAAGVTDGAAALAALGRRQAVVVRKFILELTRRHNATGGYVISGWADTPITTAGIVDDHGGLKFEREPWREFNADGVLVIDRERRRRWAGGDRPAYRDPFAWWAGERAEIHVIFSNGLGAAQAGQLRWELREAGGRAVHAGQQALGALPAAQVLELATLSLQMPETEAAAGQPQGYELRLWLDLALEAGTQHRITNHWQLWALPRPRLPRPMAVGAELLHRHTLRRLDREAAVIPLDQASPAVPALAAELTPELLDWVQAGGRAVAWLTQPDTRLTRAVPFWREAIHVFQPHRLWERVPHAGYADLRFFSVATDQALDLARLAEHLGPRATCRPVWRRFDARALTWAEYVVEVECGAGRLLVTTLRLEGGLGRQPEGFEVNPWGSHILAALLAV